jgi:hypothetical protein
MRVIPYVTYEAVWFRGLDALGGACWAVMRYGEQVPVECPSWVEVLRTEGMQCVFKYKGAPVRGHFERTVTNGQWLVNVPTRYHAYDPIQMLDDATFRREYLFDNQ